MSQSFKRTATVEFAINNTDQTVTVTNLPYIWVPAVNPDMDQEAVFEASDYLRKTWGHHVGLNVICVTTSPA